MPTTPAITATVNITVKDIKGNSVAKQFNSVGTLSFDYVKGMVMLIDLVQGQFYFPLLTITNFTYTVVSGVGGSTTVVMS
jgi:hypothetical protein